MQKSGTSTARVVVGGTLVGLVTLVVAGRLLSSGLQPPAARPTPATTVPAAIAPSTTAPVVPVVATVQVGAEPTQVAVGAGGVWVGVWATGKLVRIDPASNRVVARIPVGRPQESPIAIAVADRAVWVVDFGDARVLRIDPVTNRVVARIPVRGGAGGIGVGAGAVWVTSGEGGDQRHGWVQRLDPRRNQVTLRSGPHRPRVPAPRESAIWPPAPTRSGRALMGSCCGWIPAAATWWPRSPGLLAPTTPTVRLGPAR
jgi:DNA-binding beta-propeller fold protein YncE